MIVKPGQENWTPQVVSFLRQISEDARSIILVGDIFDFWFEWKHSIPSKAFPVLHEIKKMIESGIEVLYLGGNHDGHVGKFLQNEIGINVSRKPVKAEIDGKQFYILHGDGIAPEDHGYRILRALVRWKPTERIYRLVHPDFGIWFAHRVSRFSRYNGGIQNSDDDKPYRDFGMKMLEENDVVVVGHVHKTIEFNTGNGGFYAIGDWIESGSYGLFKAGEFRILNFEY